MAVTVAASGTETPAFGTVTVTIASPGVFSYTTHGLNAGDAVTFSTTGALPTGLTAGTTYYVIAAGLTSGAFEVSTTVGGSAVVTTGSQSGTHTVTSEGVMFDSSAAATYTMGVDLTNLASGDQVVLAVYKMMLSGGARVQIYQAMFSDAQTAAASTTPPLIAALANGQGVISIPISTGITDSGAVRFTLAQLAGTARAFPWTVEKFA